MALLLYQAKGTLTQAQSNAKRRHGRDIHAEVCGYLTRPARARSGSGRVMRANLRRRYPLSGEAAGGGVRGRKARLNARDFPTRKTFSESPFPTILQRVNARSAKPPLGQKLPTTIHDVAAAAAVSLGTVSKALNGNGQLREETRRRVFAAAKKLNFRPNDLAQSLLRGRSFTMGLISADCYGRFSIPIMEGIESALGNARMSVFLCNAADDPRREREQIEQLLAKRVDGIIVTGRRSDPRPPLVVPAHSVPVLYAFSQVEDPQALCLLPDDAGGGRLAGQHLIAAGRKRIAHITGPQDFEAVRHRCAGLRHAIEEHGGRWRNDDLMSGSWSEQWGRDAVSELLSRRHRIDAIFCGSDQIARGAADALRDHGVRVPDDIALVGFDNWQIVAAATRPALTTIDMNLRELGREAGVRLLAMIDGKTQDSGVVRLPCSLVVRESCGTAGLAARRTAGRGAARTRT